MKQVVVQPHQAMVDASIVVVAYNNQELLQATLKSVQNYTIAITYQIIVVDNASIDINWEELTKEMPSVELIRNERNSGFAAANNIGIKQSHGRYIILLNPDTLLTDDALSALVQWMDAHESVGVAAPRLMQLNGEVQPYSFGDTPTPRYLALRLWSHLQGEYLHSWQGNEPQSADWVAGTCLIVRREALEHVGPLDEQFFLYFEDVDWGLRFRSLGWNVMYLPWISITHIGGASVGSNATQHYDRSLVRLYRKYHGNVSGFGVWLALRVYRRLQQMLSHQRTAKSS